jgi:hypothetical protein
MNFRLANDDPGMLLTRLSGAVARCAAEVKEIELPDRTDGKPCTLYRSLGASTYRRQEPVRIDRRVNIMTALPP